MAAALVALYFGVHRYRYRFVRVDSELLSLLPEADATVFFADAARLRAAGYLKLLEGPARNQEKEYTGFVRETGFDYTRDLSTVAGSMRGEQIWLVLRGRFDWDRLREYMRAHGATCAGGLCGMATRTGGGRALSLRAIQPDVLALAVSADAAAAERIRPHESALVQASPAPVWLRPARSALANPAQLPLAFRIFAISLQSADSVVLTLEPSQTSGSAFAIGIDAVFVNQATAETARDQLERSTNLLKLELRRRQQQPDPRDFEWLLTAGKFQVTHEHLAGSWPVSEKLLASLQ
jgi:hypothetical protein